MHPKVHAHYGVQQAECIDAGRPGPQSPMKTMRLADPQPAVAHRHSEGDLQREMYGLHTPRLFDDNQLFLNDFLAIRISREITRVAGFLTVIM